MDNQVGHISYQIGCESEVEEHVKYVEDHLPYVLCVQIAISDRRESSDGPINGGHISDPQAFLEEVIHGCSNPCLFWIVIMCSKKIIEAPGTVNREKGDL